VKTVEHTELGHLLIVYMLIRRLLDHLRSDFPE
jgi:hypothetical protein